MSGRKCRPPEKIVYTLIFNFRDHRFLVIKRLATLQKTMFILKERRRLRCCHFCCGRLSMLQSRALSSDTPLLHTHECIAPSTKIGVNKRRHAIARTRHLERVERFAAATAHILDTRAGVRVKCVKCATLLASTRRFARLRANCGWRPAAN